MEISVRASQNVLLFGIQIAKVETSGNLDCEREQVLLMCKYIHTLIPQKQHLQQPYLSAPLVSGALCLKLHTTSSQCAGEQGIKGVGE